MAEKLIEVGKIVGAHGVRGEIRIEPWSDTPADLLKYKHFHANGAEIKMHSLHVHGNLVLASIEGVADMNSAITWRGKVLTVPRSDIVLPKGKYLICELIGLRVVDEISGESYGVISDVTPLPANDVYTVKCESGSEFMLPAVKEFVRSINIDAGEMTVRVIDGMIE